MTKAELFLELAAPDSEGKSRWVSVSEFTGKYAGLHMGNGGSWCRSNTSIAKKYRLEIDKSRTKGPAIDAIRTAGYKSERTFGQRIRKDIRDCYGSQRCVMLGVRGFSENTTIEIDHKDGRKNDWRVSDPATQRLDDFQPLCKAANDAKRQICKACRTTGKRWNARNIEGNPYPFYEGDERYTEELGCVGCYQYDPVEYRKRCVERIAREASQHTPEYIVSRLYPAE